MHKKSAPNKLAYPLGDVVDKMTILTRKVFFGEEEATKELSYLVKGLEEMCIPGEFIVAAIRLAQMNFEIWNLENDIRKGGEDKFSLEEIGRRALKIRNLNRKRVWYKNAINKLAVPSFREIKVNHQSQ